MGENPIWHKRFSVGGSFIMTGIAHCFHVLDTHRLQFHFFFLSFGTLCAIIKLLWPRCRPHGDQ